jgi:membrane protein
MANGLTYRVLLAFFPFIVFLMALLGFLQLDESLLLDRLYGMLPDDIYATVSRFLAEVHPIRSHGVLSFSLIFMVYAVANGFRTVITCINRAYGCDERDRGIIKKISVSIALMLIFTFSLLVMLVILIFGGMVWEFLCPLLPDAWEALYKLASALVSLLILMLATMFIYKLACVKKLSFTDVLPGAGVTVLLWVIFSAGFSFFIANFTNYSRIYGSIAGLFILILWLDIVSLILLLGNQINAMLKTKTM